MVKKFFRIGHIFIFIISLSVFTPLLEINASSEKFNEFQVQNSESHTKPLTLDDCIKIAMENNPLNEVAKEGVNIANDRVGEALSSYYPEIGFATGYSRWQRYAFLPNDISQMVKSHLLGPTDDFNVGLNASFLLLDSGGRRAKLKAAKASLNGAEEESERISQDIVFNVKQAFYNLGMAKENQSMAQENLERAQEHLRLAKERKDAGVVSEADVIRAQTEVAERRLSLVRAENFLRVSSGNLNISLGLSVEEEIEIDPGPEPIVSLDSISLSEALKQGIQNRPLLKAAQERLVIARSEVSSVRSAFGPKLTAEGGYGFHGPEFFQEDEEWAVGVKITWPLFTGFSRRHRLSGKRAELLKEEAKLQQLILKVQQEIWASYSKIEETYEAIETAKVLVKDAQESLRLIEERYTVGAVTIYDLLDTQTALNRSKAALLEAQWDYRKAKADFLRSIGKDL